MKANEINVRYLKSASDCYNMIDKILSDPRNCLGGIMAFNSGKQTFPTASAKRKIEALEKRASSFADCEED